MNIAFVHDIFPGGGAERVTIDIARHLNSVSESYRIYVYTPVINVDMLSDRITRNLVAIRQVPKGRTARSIEIEKLIMSDHIDIVVQVVSSIRNIDKIRKRTGCKVVFSNHGEPFWQRHDIIARKKSDSVKWKLYRRTLYTKMRLAALKAKYTNRRHYNSCDIFTVLCEEYKTLMCKGMLLNPKTAHIIPIGNSEHPVENVNYNKKNMILFSGRLENVSKRIDRLLRIWGKVQDQLADWELVIVGDGPNRKDLENQAIEEGLKRVRFEGRHADVSPFYREASILCLTSQTEGWGLCLTEAQANGVIPIAFGCTDGVKTILSPSGKNGFIVPPFDEDRFARTLLKVAHMPEEDKLALRRNCVEKSLEYSPEVIAGKWRTIFDYLHMTKIPRK